MLHLGTKDTCSWMLHLGTKDTIMVDVMVSENSLQEHGMNAKNFLCINDDMKQNRMDRHELPK